MTSRDTNCGLAAAICMAISLTSVVNSSRASMAGVTPVRTLPARRSCRPGGCTGRRSPARRSGRSRGTAMFSPSLPIAAATRCWTGPFGSFSHSSLARSPAFSISASTSCTSCWKSSVRATKSDSQLTSTSVPCDGPPRASVRSAPRWSSRPAFLAALARPFFRRIVTASSTLPLALRGRSCSPSCPRQSGREASSRRLLK